MNPAHSRGLKIAAMLFLLGRIAVVVRGVMGVMVVLATVAIPVSTLAAEQRQSGTLFMSKSTRAMQEDDSQNPAMLWVADGETLWQTRPENGGKGCADCHGEAKQGMRGVAARYPAYDKATKTPLNLWQRINQCRKSKQTLPALPAQSHDLLALEAYVAYQSRAMPLNPPKDTQLRLPTARGKRLFFERIGQLNLSCAQCHDNHWGKRLGGSTIPQGHANAYPIYRLEWQDMGSLQRRLRNCMIGVRAEPPPYGAPALVELELYLASRASGMTLESPGVRP